MTPWIRAFCKAALTVSLAFALAIALSLLLAWNMTVGFAVVCVGMSAALALTVFAPRRDER